MSEEDTESEKVQDEAIQKWIEALDKRFGDGLTGVSTASIIQMVMETAPDTIRNRHISRGELLLLRQQVEEYKGTLHQLRSSTINLLEQIQLMAEEDDLDAVKEAVNSALH